MSEDTKTETELALEADLGEAIDNFEIEEGQDENEVLQDMIRGLQTLAYERGLFMGAQTGESGNQGDATVLTVSGDGATDMLTSIIRDGFAELAIKVVD